MAKMLIATTVPYTLRCFLLPYAHHFRSGGWVVDAMANGHLPSQSDETITDTTWDSETTRAFDHVWDVEWSRNPFRLPSMLMAARRIRDVVEREGYDLVHVHTPIAAFITRYALRAARAQGRVRVIYTAHGFHFHERGSALRNGLFATMERLGGRWTDYLIVINQDDMVTASRLHIVPTERIRLFPGIGLDTRKYAPAAVHPDRASRVRAELGLSSDDRLVLMLAELQRGKRPGDAIRAIAQMGRSDVHLALAGQGPLLGELRKLAAELRVSSRIHFLGFRTDAPVLLRAADVALLCSEREGLPRSVMEAMSMGTPVIGADVRGTRDLLGDGCGLLHQPGNIDALRDCITRLLADNTLAERIRNMARAKLAAFEEANVIRMHEELYAEALADLRPDRAELAPQGEAAVTA